MNSLSPSQIEQRKPLWSAFSDLWLDNQLQDFQLNTIVKEMIKSGYSRQQLQDIYAMEVAPAVYTNLYSMAGEWAGFDEDWLYDRIIRSLEKSNLFQLRLLKIKQPLMLNMTQKNWQKIMKRYNQLNT